MVNLFIMADCPLKQWLNQYTRVPMMLLGVDQCWKMFCPNPRIFSLHSYAIITFVDGTTTYYEFPRLEKMSQWNAFLRERLRKYYCDTLPWDDFKMLRPSLARYIARCYYDPDNPPTTISLCYNSQDIPALPHIEPRVPPQIETVSKNFYVYKIRPGDFQ